MMSTVDAGITGAHAEACSEIEAFPHIPHSMQMSYFSDGYTASQKTWHINSKLSILFLHGLSVQD